jgi:hypothetical protein
MPASASLAATGLFDLPYDRSACRSAAERVGSTGRTHNLHMRRQRFRMPSSTNDTSLSKQQRDRWTDQMHIARSLFRRGRSIFSPHVHITIPIQPHQTLATHMSCSASYATAATSSAADGWPQPNGPRPSPALPTPRQRRRSQTPHLVGIHRRTGPPREHRLASAEKFRPRRTAAVRAIPQTPLSPTPCATDPWGSAA